MKQKLTHLISTFQVYIVLVHNANTEVAGACVDSTWETKFETENGMKGCMWLADKLDRKEAYCGRGDVKIICPETCDACSMNDDDEYGFNDDGYYYYDNDDKNTCVDSTWEAKFETENGMKGCMWLIDKLDRKEAYCGRGDVKIICPETCDACSMNDDDEYGFDDDGYYYDDDDYDHDDGDNYSHDNDDNIETERNDDGFPEVDDKIAINDYYPDHDSSCPEVLMPGLCYQTYHPVICGPDECEYNNLCLAEFAGFLSYECSNHVDVDEDDYYYDDHYTTFAPTQGPFECAHPGYGTCSPSGHQPVICGEHKCWYQNLCFAQSAGYSSYECGSAHPPSLPPPSTTTSPSPAPTLLPTPPNHEEECPGPKVPGLCHQDFSPLLCGEYNCWYLNGCFAQLAGFYSTIECHPYLTHVPAPSPIPTIGPPTTECPHSGHGACSLSHHPVICGEYKCLYHNLCFAQLAGFLSHECGSAHPPSHQPTPPHPAPTSIPNPSPHNTCPPIGHSYCSEVHDHVLCGPHLCWYQNLCFAQLVGFTFHHCISEDESSSPTPRPTPAPTIKTELPTPGPTTFIACPNPGYGPCSQHLIDPVTCGVYMCWYQNLCYAQLAGFAPYECGSNQTSKPVPESTNHPTSTPTKQPTSYIACPNSGYGICPHQVIDPVECGSKHCWYQNLCYAQNAGFVPFECINTVSHPFPSPTPSPTHYIACPVISGGSCPKILDPVECGVHKCWYTNSCFAQLGGFAGIECEDANPSPTPGPSVSDNCPDAMIGGYCAQVFEPVECGRYNCWYMNSCFAKLAGFTENECNPETASPVLPTPSPTSLPTPLPTPSISSCEDAPPSETFRIKRRSQDFPYVRLQKSCYWMSRKDVRAERYCQRSRVRKLCPYTCCVCEAAKCVIVYSSSTAPTSADFFTD
jgi:hypothetical protein